MDWKQKLRQNLGRFVVPEQTKTVTPDGGTARQEIVADDHVDGPLPAPTAEQDSALNAQMVAFQSLMATQGRSRRRPTERQSFLKKVEARRKARKTRRASRQANR